MITDFNHRFRDLPDSLDYYPETFDEFLKHVDVDRLMLIERGAERNAQLFEKVKGCDGYEEGMVRIRGVYGTTDPREISTKCVDDFIRGEWTRLRNRWNKRNKAKYLKRKAHNERYGVIPTWS